MKYFSSIMLALIFCSFICVSCKKENVAPQNAKQQSSNSSKVSAGSGGSDSSTPPTDYTHGPGKCPGH